MTTSATRLWQLISPTLPIGTYSYSQGLESAVANGWLTDEATVQRWIADLLTHTLGHVDIPLLARLHASLVQHDQAAFTHWDTMLIACRETKELRDEERAVGAALTRLLAELDIATHKGPLTYVGAFAVAADAWEIDQAEAARGYAWAWCENQVAAAIKLVPLGHSAGQRVLLKLSDVIDNVARAALDLDDVDIGLSAHGLAIASAQHETQYSRLFRS